MAGKPGRSGRKPKPIERLVAAGQYRADRHGLPLAVAPDVPDDGWVLDPKAALDRILAEGVSWLAGSDGIAVAMLYEALETHTVAKSYGSIRDQIVAQQNVVGMLAAFGFEPSARARMGLTTARTVSRLELLRAKAIPDRGPKG